MPQAALARRGHGAMALADCCKPCVPCTILRQPLQLLSQCLRLPRLTLPDSLPPATPPPAPFANASHTISPTSPPHTLHTFRTCSGTRYHLLTATDLTAWLPGSSADTRTFSASSSRPVVPSTTYPSTCLPAPTTCEPAVKGASMAMRRQRGTYDNATRTRIDLNCLWVGVGYFKSQFSLTLDNWLGCATMM